MTDPAKLRALLLGVPTPGFSVAEAIDELETRLRRMDPDVAITTHHHAGGWCTREQLLDVIDRWIDRSTTHDHCLLYYFGHGGRVRFTGLGPEIAERVFTYLSCEREDLSFTGILDLELSTRIATLDRRCAGVTTIIDACYSGTVVRSLADESEESERRETVSRSSLLVIDDAPEWIARVLRPRAGFGLASESHPRVVRLAGASPRIEGHLAESAWQPRLRQGPTMGMFTAALLDTLAAAGDDWRRLSWDSLAHAIRERVIAAFRMESQWIAQAGPCNRRIFSSDPIELPRTVGFVETKYGYWIRAGALAGVEVGDRWAVADPLVDERGRHRELTRGTIDRVDLNRARLVLDHPLTCNGLGPASAFVVGLRRRVPVQVDGRAPEGLRSPWLCEGDETSRHRVRIDDEAITLHDRQGEWATAHFSSDANGWLAAIELLEDRARSARLVEALEHTARGHQQTAPVDWELGIDDGEISGGAVVSDGARVWVRLRNPKRGGQHWFASVILIDFLGRPWLLNASQPDGVELEANDLEYVGRRPGAARGGIELRWPDNTQVADDGQVRLLLLVSGRPTQLGHLVHSYPDTEIEAFRMQGAELDRAPSDTLSPVPASSKDWRWDCVELRLRPASTNSN